MDLEVKALKDIYLYLELQFIHAPNVPDLAIAFINNHPQLYLPEDNKPLLELISLHKPGLYDIQDLMLRAFNIEPLSPYEKILIIINWFENKKLSTAKAYNLIFYFDYKYADTLKSYDLFRNNFYNYIYLGTYGGQWDDEFLTIKAECESKIDVFHYQEYMV